VEGIAVKSIRGYRYLVVSLFIVGCAKVAPRLVPIQSARNIQVEEYHHVYDIRDPRDAQRIFLHILGNQNVCALAADPSKKDRWTSYINDVTVGHVEIVGQVLFSVSLYPHHPDRIYIDGLGNYFVRNNASEELLASADFHVVDPRPHKMIEGNHAIDLRIKQVVARQFQETCKSYVYPSEIILRIYVEEIEPGILSLANGPHELGIRVSKFLNSTEQDDDPDEIEAWPIGCLSFIDHGDGRKIVDLREVSDLVKNDYAERLRDYGTKLGRAKYKGEEREPAKIIWGKAPGCNRDPRFKNEDVESAERKRFELSEKLPLLNVGECSAEAKNACSLDLSQSPAKTSPTAAILANCCASLEALQNQSSPGRHASYSVPLNYCRKAQGAPDSPLVLPTLQALFRDLPMPAECK
jgi:hypothetical protein